MPQAFLAKSITIDWLRWAQNSNDLCYDITTLGQFTMYSFTTSLGNRNFSVLLSSMGPLLNMWSVIDVVIGPLTVFVDKTTLGQEVPGSLIFMASS